MARSSSPFTLCDSDTRAALSRRTFIGGALTAAASASSLGGLSGLAAESPAGAEKPAEITRKIKLGLVGCGGRGSWITTFFRNHGGFEFHAVADYFQEVADQTGEALGLDRSRRFAGLSGYRRVLDSGVEALVIEDIPWFYPEQAQAAVEAGCHVYIAKPVAVDVPGCLTIEAAAKRATAQQRCFLVDYQLPTQPPNIEVATRIREGALGALAHILSYGLNGGGVDVAKGPTIANLFRGQQWTQSVPLGGDNIAYYDIHILDGVTWIMGRRPVGACGRSRICRPGAHGDRTDCSGMLFEYDDGVIWNHATNALNNNGDLPTLTASFYGSQATARIQYWGKAYVRGGPRHYVGDIGSIYDDGVVRNVAEFYRNIKEGHFENPTAKRAVDGTLTAILGREAAARRGYLTMDEVLKERRKLEVDLTGLQA
jgi:myo-inositol 2-dehydrogenase / D-chiro-inositol 1-dehydrogenase